MIKSGNQIFYYVYFNSKFYGECRESVWATTKKEAKEKFVSKMGKMKITRVEFVEDI